jgi:prepilin-type N-terminal cleavage/methylation domain-containing protein
MADQQKLYDKHDHLPKLAKGFSLVELMVALAIAGFLAIGLWALMQSQNKTYAAQQNGSQMQQNLRAAIDWISGDLRTAGQGPPWQMTFNQLPVPLTTTWYVMYPAPNNTFGAPYSYVLNSKQLDIIGYTSLNTQLTLASQATAGTNTITLSAGQGAYFALINANPPRTYYIDIGDEGAYESAKVTAVAGDTLTIDTNPGGGVHTLAGSYAPGTNISILQWVTYVVNTATNPTQLTRDAHDTTGPQPVAYYITNLTAAITAASLNPVAPAVTPDGGALQVTLTASTGGVNPLQSQAVELVHLRNP